MIKLQIRLTEEAEKSFQELLDKTGASKEVIILDALALLHCAVTEVAGGKRMAIFNPKTKEATPITLFTLSLIS